MQQTEFKDNKYIHQLIDAIELGNSDCISFENNILVPIESMLKFSNFIHLTPLPDLELEPVHVSTWTKPIQEKNENLYIEIFSNNFSANWRNEFTIINIYTCN